jgi:hypothetical protein
MATNNRPLKAYVRYDGSGRAVSSSLIWRKNKPKVGNWKEVQGYECCDGGGTFTTQIAFSPLPDQQIYPGLGLNVFCEETLVLSYLITYPSEINTIQETVDYLNTTFTGIATFSVVNSFTASVTFSDIIANALCPSGTLTIVTLNPA